MQADWGAPEDNGSAITGYQIDSADNAAFTGRTRATITATSTLAYRLCDGDDVFVRVRAQNGQGNGAWSPTATLTRDDGLDVPGTPSTPVGAQRMAGHDKLWSWRGRDDGGSAITWL